MVVMMKESVADRTKPRPSASRFVFTPATQMLVSDEIMDEEPMEEDYVLTDDEDEDDDEVDWSQLPTDCIDTILGYVAKVTTDYWTDMYSQSKDFFGTKFVGVCNPRQARLYTSGMNRHRTFNNRGYQEKYLWCNWGGNWECKSVRERIQMCQVVQPYYMPKITNTRNKRVAKSKTKCVCSKCGKVGHRCNNSKFH
tara:strand:- start:1747 stop:2334 length:588 start_codon:yes stop_codon:yes gene_type:complete